MSQVISYDKLLKYLSQLKDSFKVDLREEADKTGIYSNKLNDFRQKMSNRFGLPKANIDFEIIDIKTKRTFGIIGHYVRNLKLQFNGRSRKGKIVSGVINIVAEYKKRPESEQELMVQFAK